MRDILPKRSKAGTLSAFSLMVLLSGCAAGRATPVGHLQSIDPPLQTIALAPNSGLFADLIGLELSEQGYTIVDTGATLALLMLMHKPQDKLLSPEILAMLKARDIDAVLVVQKVDDPDGLPQTIHLRLHSTTLQADVGGIDWENGWIHRSVVEAAQEIAVALHKTAQPIDVVSGDAQGAASFNGSEP